MASPAVKPSTLSACTLLAIALAAGALADPLTMVSVTNANPGAGGVSVADTEFLQTSWSQSTSYPGVDVSAWLFGNFVNGVYSPSSGTAYLTSSLGLNLAQSFVFPDPAGSIATNVLLFSGLDLPAATYFLTLAASDAFGGAWASDLQQSSTIVLDNGITLGAAMYAPSANVNPADPPASTFIQANPSIHYFFEVIDGPAEAPEPASLSLIGIGLLALAIRRWSVETVRA